MPVSIPCFRKYSQSQYRKAVAYSAVLHPTFLTCTTRMSVAVIVLATVFFIAWYKIINIQCSLVVYRGIYPTCHLRRVCIPRNMGQVGYSTVYHERVLHN